GCDPEGLARRVRRDPQPAMARRPGRDRGSPARAADRRGQGRTLYRQGLAQGRDGTPVRPAGGSSRAPGGGPDRAHGRGARGRRPAADRTSPPLRADRRFAAPRPGPSG
ncbi:MAG: hypothetical protein AVDCRST_MAG31-783, partial [uncultured Sphingomonas sp.]